jgi:nucleobase transporter 1/2
MFGLIAAVGMSNLQYVDMNSSRNLFIVGFSLFMGLSLPKYFQSNPIRIAGAQEFADVINTIFLTSMTVGLLFALILDNTIPGTDEERGITKWKTVRGSDDSYK